MASKKRGKVFRLRLAPYRDPVTMRMVGDSGCVEVRGVDSYAQYGENEGDLAMFVVVDSSGAQVFSCPLERVVECISEGNLVGKEKASPPHGSTLKAITG